MVQRLSDEEKLALAQYLYVEEDEQEVIPDDMFDEVRRIHAAYQPGPPLKEETILLTEGDIDDIDSRIGTDVMNTVLETPVLMQRLVEAVDMLTEMRQGLTQLHENARGMQVELASRGMRIDFDELNAPMIGGTEVHTVGPITPSPGLTTGIPEPEEERGDGDMSYDPTSFEEQTPSSAIDTRNVAAIRREATPPPSEADRANFAQQTGADHLKAIEIGMSEAKRLQRRAAGR